MAVVQETLLGNFSFSFEDSGATRPLTLSVSTVDDETDQANRQEFRRLPGNVIKTLQDKIVEFVNISTVTNISLALNLTNFKPWNSQVQKIFVSVRNGYRPAGWDLGTGVNASNVRNFVLSK